MASQQHLFRGVFTALITPFRNGRIDAPAFKEFIDWQIAEGVHGLVPAGTTGESPTLTPEEHCEVISLCVEAAAGRVPVMAGTGANNTAEAVAFTHHAKEAGADAALIVTPYYNKPTPAGLIAHFSAIHEAVDIPIFIYNIPGRSVIDMADGVLAELAKLPRIIGVKDATGDLSRVATLRTAAGEDFIQLSGEDMTAVGFNAMGGQGCISVTANIAPALCARLQEATLAGDYARALALQDELTSLHRAMFLETSPGPVKYAASLLGKCSAEIRLPLVPPSVAICEQIQQALTKTVGL